MKASEHQHQCSYVQWCDLNRIPVYVNPNEIWLPIPRTFPVKYQNSLKTITRKVISKIKTVGGLSKGIPDLTIPVKTEKYGALYIELKIKGNYPTKEQKEYMKMLEDNGNKCVVCYGSSEAIDETVKYLKGE